MRVLLYEESLLIGLEIKEIIHSQSNQDVELFLKPEHLFTAILIRPPDVIILDIPPGKSNQIVDLIFRIRTRFSIPVLILSGIAVKTIESYLPFLDQVTFLSKPFLPFQITEILNSFLIVRS